MASRPHRSVGGDHAIDKGFLDDAQGEVETDQAASAAEAHRCEGSVETDIVVGRGRGQPPGP